MAEVDIKSLLDKLNLFCRQSLEDAALLAVTRTHYEISVEHMFNQMLENTHSDISLILRHFNISAEEVKSDLNAILEDFTTGNGGKPVFSPRIIDWFKQGHMLGTVNLNEPQIRSGTLFCAFANTPFRFSSDGIVELIKDMSRETLLANFDKIVEKSIEQPKGKKKKSPKSAGSDPESALGKYCEDFTKKAAEGNIDPIFGRDNEIRQIIDIFARRRKNNPIVVGEAGVGKTAMAEGLALRIVKKDVPDFLKNVTIFSLDLGLLQAGAGVKGEFENRLKKVITEVKSSEKPIILFIDEAHTMIGAGASQGGSDAANLLKPALARGELRTIAATTWSEYKKYFEKDAALARRFQPVLLDEPSQDTTTLILRGLKKAYEKTHGVIIRDDAILAASELSARYISGRYLPDKAIDLIDTCSARVKVLLTGKPDVVEDLERRLQAAKREKEALERDGLHGLQRDEKRLKEIEKEVKKFDKGLKSVSNKWKKEQKFAEKLIKAREKNAKKPDETLEAEIKKVSESLFRLQKNNPIVRTEVCPEIISKVVSDWTGIPVGRVMHDEAQSIIDLETNLAKRIRGQNESLQEIARIIKASKAGLTEPARPMGVFLLVGPSGVGKTETGLAMADLLFGGERFIVSVNMSEFQEKHTISRLIGSPPGYIGFGEGGVLTEAVRQRPYSVLLLDEAEKASPEVMNIFYQVFDKGVLEDGEGKKIDFKNTVIFLTSNLGSDVITELCTGNEKPDIKTVLTAIRPMLNAHFKPALLARMAVVPYFGLDSKIMGEIVEIKLKRLEQRLHESHKLKLKYSDKVKEQISARCLEVETGARNIDHIMTGRILPEISNKILTSMTEETMPEKVMLDVGEDGKFIVRFGK